MDKQMPIDSMKISYMLIPVVVEPSLPTVRQARQAQRKRDREQISKMAWILFFMVFFFMMGFWCRSGW